MNNIVLCGFMGCGKSTVGQILAQMTGRAFVDTDQLIESNENMISSLVIILINAIIALVLFALAYRNLRKV